MAESEIIFSVQESPEGGYEARALGFSIYTQTDTSAKGHGAGRCALPLRAAKRTSTYPPSPREGRGYPRLKLPRDLDCLAFNFGPSTRFARLGLPFTVHNPLPLIWHPATRALAFQARRVYTGIILI
jgi:hypothetical protein